MLRVVIIAEPILEIVMKKLAVLALTLASVLSAAAQPVNERPVGPIVGEGQAPLSRVQVINGIEVMNGGANIADANYLTSRTGEFGVRFVFSGRCGEYGVAEQLTLLQQDYDVTFDVEPDRMGKGPKAVNLRAA